MQDFSCEFDVTAIDVEHALSDYRIRQLAWQKWDDESDSLAHADTKDRDLSCKMSNDIAADTRIGLRVARSRADDNLGWLFGDELLDGDLVVPDHITLGTRKAQVLVDVPGERVIVVNENQIRSRWNRVSRLGLMGGVVNYVFLLVGRHCVG